MGQTLPPTRASSGGDRGLGWIHRGEEARDEGNREEKQHRISGTGKLRAKCEGVGK